MERQKIHITDIHTKDDIEKIATLLIENGYTVKITADNSYELLKDKTVGHDESGYKPISAYIEFWRE